MLNWNWSYTLSTSVVALAIVSSLASHSAQAQTEVKATNVSTSLSNSSNSLKVGETRSQSLTRTKDDSIARIHTHKLNGKNAATVYVRGIPVVTYIESEESAKSATENTANTTSDSLKTKGETKKNSESVKLPASTTNLEPSNSDSPAKSADDSSENLLTSANPVERATAAAALINQLNRDGLDANKIIPAWKNGNYVIKLGDRAMLKFDQQAVFPGSLQNQTQDVLESANLLRRLLGRANPVVEVVNAPKPKIAARSTSTPALNNRIVGVMSGMASWYGPGFDGNYSASGEIFRASELTAAHPSLPFGTLVRVVNMDNNQSVVVRINDRGPYIHGRVIDISTAAANVIGLISSGVAPVRLEVLSK
ncbi:MULTISPECIES: septal ring lytic transglycosylase RlpA family protein [Pseudanabaena]|jgi:rare lipoprotein A|uniref:septal ring lytic transglycosylase RlpA family protein n=1 Tax=Pseudanabaena TaxID=1152 RepID=UPI00247A85BD|nr:MULTISPECIES: septal ring lytic transglycosylase RlpA family protein [Pseudanabaena]MEA5485696.1 septal ring lytic transglycosylase RlpA family protein [Pseudanabaena sp. CCNP1317]WGS72040.1 septal ring lytic transglycosylase RlpA family protein [Pseudanabaena galeata CCNP1313]